MIAVGGLLALACLPLVRLFGPALAGRSPVSIVALALLGFFAPATVLSAVPPMVVKVQLDSLHETGRTVGRLSAVSTVGALVGVFATGFVLLAAFPTPPIVVALGCLLVAAGGALWVWLPRAGSGSPTGAMLGAVVLAAVGLTVGTPCEHETAYFCAAVVADAERVGGRLLVLDTLRHSYVDLDDPTHLEFAYTRNAVDVVDTVFGDGGRLDAVHIGGGGFTLPGYLAADRPGTTSVVLELDPELVDLARAELGLRTGADLRVRTGDARLALTRMADDSADLVIGDAFGGLAVPWHLTTEEVVDEVDRVLRPGGIYVLNMIDHPPLAFARAEAATLDAVFDDVAIVAPTDRLAGEVGGNFVMVGASGLDAAAVQARLDRRDEDQRVIVGTDVSAFVDGAPVLTDAYAPVDQLLEPQPAP